MSDEEIPLLERVANYYSQLSTVAADLNAVSDELGKSIAEIDAALKRLNLGITTWVTIQSGEGDRSRNDNSFWSRDIGYAKVDSKWGIGLRKVEGNYNYIDEENIEEWLFNDAPRSLRLEAIDKIPELLETLSKDAVKTTKDIRARLGEVQAVAEAVKGAANHAAQGPISVSSSDSKPKIDLSHISKPGDVLKAILAQKQISQTNPSDLSAIPASDALDLSSIRHAVASALVEAGHASAAQALGVGIWSFDGTRISIEIASMGRKMLALTLNAAAVKVVQRELKRLGAPAEFQVVPGGEIMQAAAPKSASDTLTAASAEVKQ